MAEHTAISWTDSTVNFWWGCTKVGPGCDHCYAEAWSKRTGESIWGVGAPRRKIKSAVALLHRLDNGYADWAADYHCKLLYDHCGHRRRVFIQSMSDLFDLEVPVEWFAEAWQTMERCDRIHIQAVTKRISTVEKRLAAIGRSVWPRHIGLMITVVDQAEADRDIPRLIALKAKLGLPWIGLSMEPLLGAVVLRPEWLAEIDWIIVGGESGPHARPMHPDWARTIRDACAAAGIAFHFKQWGEWLPMWQSGFTAWRADTRPRRDRAKWLGHAIFNDGAGSPETHRIGPVPTTYIATPGGTIQRMAVKIGKARAGRLLDGITHDEFPRQLQ